MTDERNSDPPEDAEVLGTDTRWPSLRSADEVGEAGPAHDARALREMIDELRDVEPPPVDWASMETALWSQIDGDRPGLLERLQADRSDETRAQLAEGASTALVARPVAKASGDAPVHGEADARPGLHGRDTSGSSSTLWWAFAAAAAVVFGLVLPKAHTSDAPTAAVDLAALGAGEVVEAGLEPMRLEATGRVALTLAPGSRFEVVDPVEPGLRDQHIIRLERGSVRAEVTPALAEAGIIETFVVEAGGTRVAVRGTVFSVTRAGPGLVVDVERGAVAVGQLGEDGLTEGKLLRADERAGFSLDGGTRAERLQPARRGPPDEGPQALVPAGRPLADGSLRDASDSHAAESPQVAPKVAGAIAALPEAPKGDAPLAQLPASAKPAVPAKAAQAPEVDAVDDSAPVARFQTVGGLRAGLMGCFQRVYGNTAAHGLTISTVFHVSVSEAGHVQSAQFVPPLKPAMAECAGTLIGVPFEEGPQQLQVPLLYRP